MRLFSPKRYVSAVEKVDLQVLKRHGKSAILLDRDNTLVPRDKLSAPKAVAAWLEEAKRMGFELCIVSNNWHKSHVERSANELGGLDYICFACKPFPFAIDAGLKRLGKTKAETVMIGDQLYTDVWAGNFAGVDTILVKPQTTVDLWYTKVFRIFERQALKDLECED